MIAYHLRQSFKPEEITPELANKIGYGPAMSQTKGRHAFIACIHVDKHHIHSHAEPKPSRGSYSTWLGEDKPPTVRGKLAVLIDAALGHGCKDFDSFLAAMKGLGAEVKRGKHLAFKIPSGKRFIRCDSLGDDYTEIAIMERISGKRMVAPKAKAAAQSKPNLLIDIQAKMPNIGS